MAHKPHYRAVARFNLGHQTIPKETANCGLNFRPSDVEVGELDEDFLPELAEHVWTCWAAYLSNSDARFSGRCWLAEVRAYTIGTDGRAIHPMSSYVGSVTNGQHNTGLHPWSVSWALTLVGKDPGAGRFGRIYLPPQAIEIVAEEGAASQAAIEGVMTPTGAFLDALSDLPGADFGRGLVVASTKGEGKLNEIEEFRIGRVPDTQRRRRRQLDENYVVGQLSN